MNQIDNEDIHSIIISLLEENRYKEAAKIARLVRDKFPEEIEPHLLLGIALMKDEKYDKSRRVIDNALKKFPNESRLHQIMGHVHGYLNKLKEAEECYRSAIKFASDEDPEEKAILYFYLADNLWGQNRRDDAIANWKIALEFDPGCIEAEEALEETINEYNEPKSPTPIFDDLYHFQNIHFKRYFALVNRDEFIDDDEAKSVIGITMNGWNKFVSPRSKDIDKLTTEERTAFFKSITLDFKNVVVKWKDKKC